MYGRFFKRFFDIFFATLILLVAWPFMLIIALIIKIDSKGPVIFKQKRIGRGGKLFEFCQIIQGG